MKLLYCPICNDIKALTRNLTKCRCRKTMGLYVSCVWALWSGPGNLIGMRNFDIKEMSRSRDYPWWPIPNGGHCLRLEPEVFASIVGVLRAVKKAVKRRYYSGADEPSPLELRIECGPLTNSAALIRSWIEGQGWEIRDGFCMDKYQLSLEPTQYACISLPIPYEGA